ncbi:MAG TPA: tetratricopeptide repeat protein [Pirellulales bacterium]|nr:tetratricopeptide repeat protein [Pirellulales bacterium]
MSPARADETVDRLLADSKTAWNAGDRDRAIELATRAIEADSNDARLHLFRGTLYEHERKHQEAVNDFDQAIKLAPRDAEAYEHRGSERFKLGRIADSIADFDQEIALDPKREPGHWKRGISYYYAGRYDEGRRQFEGYQTVDGNDVENAVWRFLCMARKDGPEKARGDLLKIKQDRRIPMMQIYALFAGRAKPDDVMAAVQAGEPAAEESHHRQFYAELYLGLYREALGDETDARRHLRAAVDHKIGHYMWDVAKVHLDLLDQARRKPSAN